MALSERSGSGHSTISFTIRGDSNNFIDEPPIGTTCASVVPEPSTAALLVLGVAALGAWARLRAARRR